MNDPWDMGKECIFCFFSKFYFLRFLLGFFECFLILSIHAKDIWVSNSQHGNTIKNRVSSVKFIDYLTSLTFLVLIWFLPCDLSLNYNLTSLFPSKHMKKFKWLLSSIRSIFKSFQNILSAGPVVDFFASKKAMTFCTSHFSS